MKAPSRRRLPGGAFCSASASPACDSRRPRACFHLPRRPFFPRIPPAAPHPPSALPRPLVLSPHTIAPVRAPFCLPLPPQSSRACPPLLLLSFSVRFPGRAFPRRRRPSPVSPLSRFVLPTRSSICAAAPPSSCSLPDSLHPRRFSPPPGPHPCLRRSPAARLRHRTFRFYKK